VSDSLPVLARVLSAGPKSEALVTFGRLLDSLPVAVLVTDCSEDLLCVYGNASWRAWVPGDKLPIEGRPLPEVIESLAGSSLLEILRQGCISGVPAHLRDLEYAGLVGALVTLPGDTTMWDWEIYPLAGATCGSGYLLIVGIDVTDRALRCAGGSPEARARAALMRERASSILRIFGVAPDTRSSVHVTRLSKREQEVAELVARGMSNEAMGRELCLSRTTVATHVAHILGKLGFSSRVEIAAWVVERRLRDRAQAPPG
jgi:DNA-binding CsgD family transcriptional regulator